MGWIGDVIPRTTIRSVWGNAVRNQLVQRFASAAERDGASPRQPGMLGFVDADHGFSYTETDNTWRPLTNALPKIWNLRVGYAQGPLGFVDEYPIEGGANALYVPFSPEFAPGSNVIMVANVAGNVGWFGSVSNVTPYGGRVNVYTQTGVPPAGTIVGATYIAVA